jgi:cholesterol oxidase
MHWLSHGVEQLITSCQDAQQPYAPEVVVVGSGYGGAVAALRFAQHGLQVAVLERGSEYVAGEFPTDAAQLGGFVRAEVAGKLGTRAVGYEDALFDFRIGTRANALVGNGLGGGSLINAAVALRPDPRVFAQDAWPAPLRRDNLDADFAAAYAGLEVQSPQDQEKSPQCVPQHTIKHQRLQDIGKAAHARFASAQLSVTTEGVPLAIEFRPQPPTELGPRDACVGCGDCFSGCNHNAKLSLDKTYLAQAHRLGVRMFTGVTVLYVAHQPDAAHPGRDWVVHCVRTTERQTWGEACQAGVAAAYTFSVRTARVVLAGGTFGSTEILQRSREKGLAVADAWLGKGISANGDDLSAAYDLRAVANGIGQGSGPTPSSTVGPTISGVIRFHDHQDHTRSTVTEDGGIPGMFAPLVGELITTLGVLPQLTRWGQRSQGQQDPLAVRPDAIARSLAMLGMGHDSSAGSARLDGPHARLSWQWDKDAVDPAPTLHRARAASVEDLGAEFLPNPASGVLPDKIAAILSGPKPENGWVTVHPLGGCRMAGSPAQGVVNHRCEVFQPNGEVWAGLQVMDGSVIPTSLGVNPLLTITAVAERACRLLLADRKPVAHQPAALPTHPGVQPTLKAVPHAPRGAVLAEVLRGPLQNSAGGHTNAALFLEMDVPDWRSLWQDPRHVVAAVPSVHGARSFTASRVVLDTGSATSTELRVTGGTVELFAPAREWWPVRVDRLARAALTYWIARWHPDGVRPEARSSSWQVKWDGFKLLWNATAARTFDYQLQLTDGTQSYRLVGSKLMQPALTWTELCRWAQRKWSEGGWPAPQRRSVWDQLTQLDVQIYQGAERTPMAQGRLAMDIPEMVRRIAPQIKPGADWVNAFAALASYPLTIARYVVGSRILDFRLPDYAPHLPATDPAVLPDNGQFELSHDHYPPLPVRGGQVVQPQSPVCLHVPLHAGTTPAPGSADSIRIGLVRYAQSVVATHDSRSGMRRFKSIILLNGFAQNTLPFVAPELGERSLAAMLYAQGWDVWLLEYRVSPFLRASARLSSMDDIGAGDIPAAVNHALAVLQAERHQPDLLPGQLFVLSHCVGSASMGMSLLGGHLTHPGGQPKVAGVLFSQFQPYVIGSVTAQMRVQVASTMVNAMGLEYLNFAAGTALPDALHALADRVFASFHYDAAERCPGEHDLRNPRPDCTSCKRMSGFLSRLFRHDQLIEGTAQHKGTHEKLDEYFGRTNLGVFLHGAKCVEYEHLVDADGQNIYVTDDNVRKYLSMPVMLLHGEDNVLFDKESLQETWRQFSRAFGAERLQTRHDRFLTAPGHAHFDCTIGKRAPEVIFEPVVEFFNNAFQAEMPVQGEHNRLRARLPRTGPIAGWCRQEGDQRVLRVWIEVDNSRADLAVAAMTVVSVGRYRRVQAWSLSSSPLQGLVGVAADAAPDQSVTYAVADIEVPASWQGRISVAMVSLHRFTGDVPHPNDCSNDTDHAWPAAWGQPMTVDETETSDARSPGLTQCSRTAVVAALAAQRRAQQGPNVAPTAAPPPAYTPGARIAPLDMALELSDARVLLKPLAHLVRRQRALTRSAAPGTLSRQRRTLRWMDECVLRLHAQRILPEQASEQALRFVAATCRHPGITELEAARSDATLLALAQHQRTHPASLMWMLGDQIYADARAGLADTASPVELLLPRYREAFGSKGFRALARSLPLHMVMDDHEIGDNWSRDDVKLTRQKEVLTHNALAAFNAFQRAHGPAACGPDHADAAFTVGGVAFLSLNTRLHRDRALGAGGQRRILADAQWNLLEHWLRTEQSKGAHPKFVVSGSVFAPGLVQGVGQGPNAPSLRTVDNWQLVQPERQRLLAFIARERIDNVVFLSGDYHCSATATIAFSHSRVRAYCLVTPPLHAPLVFANVAASDVLTYEEVVLDEGVAQIDAQAWNGEGWLECEVARQGARHQLRASLRMQPLDAPQPHTITQVWEW